MLEAIVLIAIWANVILFAMRAYDGICAVRWARKSRNSRAARRLAVGR